MVTKSVLLQGFLGNYLKFTYKYLIVKAYLSLFVVSLRSWQSEILASNFKVIYVQ